MAISQREALRQGAQVRDRIAKLLAENGPMTKYQLADPMGMDPEAVRWKLSTMVAQGVVMRDDDARYRLTGREPRPRSTRERKACISFGDPCVRIVPAVQVGARRDYLVAALFGPR